MIRIWPGPSARAVECIARNKGDGVGKFTQFFAKQKNGSTPDRKDLFMRKTWMTRCYQNFT